jgi:hypothetical protein
VVDGWLAEQRRLWEQRLDQLDALLAALPGTTATTRPDTSKER